MQPVFRAKVDGYGRFRVPAIVVADGAILAFAEGRRGMQGDWGAIDIVMRRSVDGGETWGPIEVLGIGGDDVERNPAALEKDLSPEGEVTYHNPTVIAAGADVHLLYCVHYRRLFYRRSRDAGVTFGPAVDIANVFADPGWPGIAWRVLAVGPGHAIKTSNGRLLVPAWLSPGTEGRHAHAPSVGTWIHSDDDGATWRAGMRTTANTDAAGVNASEGSPVEHGGRSLVYMRTERGFHVSDVAGGTQRVNIDGPVCQGSVLALPSGRLAFSALRHGEPRSHLRLCVSDDGIEWREGPTIDAGSARYSDLAFTPRGLACLYEYGSQTKGGIGLAFVDGVT